MLRIFEINSAGPGGERIPGGGENHPRSGDGDGGGCGDGGGGIFSRPRPVPLPFLREMGMSCYLRVRRENQLT